MSGEADRFYSIATNSNEGRSITEPTSQTIIKGPKDAFTENINKNVFFDKKRIKSTALRVENLTIAASLTPMSGWSTLTA
jgi:spore germination protein KA